MTKIPSTVLKLTVSGYFLSRPIQEAYPLEFMLFHQKKSGSCDDQSLLKVDPTVTPPRPGEAYGNPIEGTACQSLTGARIWDQRHGRFSTQPNFSSALNCCSSLQYKKKTELVLCKDRFLSQGETSIIVSWKCKPTVRVRSSAGSEAWRQRVWWSAGQDSYEAPGMGGPQGSRREVQHRLTIQG